jgi:uncharacterized membrane protein YphA (DoxX/SURF4 family)
MNTLWIILRLLVGALFAYAGFSKLLEPMENFAASLSQYNLIPTFVIVPIARVLPWVEWIGGCFLFLGYAPRQAAITLASMTFIFLVVLISAFFTGSASGGDCGCFGGSGIHLTTKQVFVVDVISFSILLRLFFLKNFPWSLDALLKSEKLKPKPKFVKGSWEKRPRRK